VLFYLLKEEAISLFTGLDTVAELANRYSVWLIWSPFISSLGLVFYGVFTGSSVTRPIRNSMIGAFIAFLAARFLLVDNYHNDGLWIAFLVFSLTRSLILVAFVPKLENILFYNRDSLKQEVTIPTK
jgi:MATE family multidrug resistance protein